MGLKQADEIQDDKLTDEYATKVFRPSIASVETIGIGSLDVKNVRFIYENLITKIQNTTKLEDKLNLFLYECGHLPLKEEFSANRIINNHIKGDSNTLEDRWEMLWLWAKKTNSPIARYHITFYFLTEMEYIPESKYEDLYIELQSIVCTISDKSKDLEWFESWRFRLDLAKIFGQFIESKLPGSNTEKIYSQAWWMSERIASIYTKKLLESNDFIGQTCKYSASFQ